MPLQQPDQHDLKKAGESFQQFLVCYLILKLVIQLPLLIDHKHVLEWQEFFLNQ